MKNLKKKKSLNIVLIEECPELTSMLTKAVYCLGHSLISFSTPIEAIKELPNLNYIV